MSFLKTRPQNFLKNCWFFVHAPHKYIPEFQGNHRSQTCAKVATLKKLSFFRCCFISEQVKKSLTAQNFVILMYVVTLVAINILCVFFRIFYGEALENGMCTFGVFSNKFFTFESKKSQRPPAQNFFDFLILFPMFQTTTYQIFVQ